MDTRSQRVLFNTEILAFFRENLPTTTKQLMET